MMRRATIAVVAALMLLGGFATIATPAQAASGTAITIKSNGHCLDADLNRINIDGAKIQLWGCNNSNQQKWYWGANNTIRSKYNNKCLDADANNINANGAKIQLWACNNSNQQYWNKLSDNSKSQDCPRYGNDRVVQTGMSIARIREQVCIYYDSAIVYAVARLQVDWPSNCTVEVGLPPTGTIGCPLSSWLTKSHDMAFDHVKINLDFQVPGGNVVSQMCTWGRNYKKAPGSLTFTCRYGTSTRVAGRQYTVSVHDTGADLYGDHTGYQLLDPGNYTFRP